MQAHARLLLNLGCGTNPAHGWVNLDRSPGLELRRVPPVVRRGLSALGLTESLTEWPDNVRRVDVTRGLPFAGGSVDAVYSSHMLEHLSAADAGRVLDECRRVLKPNGVLRLALPDLRAMATTYLASSAVDAADRFVEETLLGWSEMPKGVRRLVGIVSGARHRWMYDAASIQQRCRNRGFTTEEVSVTESAQTSQPSSTVRGASSSRPIGNGGVGGRYGPDSIYEIRPGAGTL
jgi:predicted SAM-dependent methyltransferase